jgi:hypothetical protein
LDKTLIYQAIENPAMRKAISIEELEKIQKSYPYFSTAHVLLAKMYQEKNDHRFADQLQQAALYVNNRHVLYDYIKDSQKEEDSQFSILDSRKEDDSQFSILEAKKQEQEQEDSQFSILDSEKEEDFEKVGTEDLELRIANFESRIANLELGIENRESRIENQELTAPVEETLDQNFESRIANLEVGIENRESRIENQELNVENQELRIENPEPIEETPDESVEVVRAKDLDPMEANFIIEAVHSTIELEAEEETEQEAVQTAERGGQDSQEIPEIAEIEEEPQTPMTYAEYMMAKARKMKGEVKEEPEAKDIEEVEDEVEEQEEEKTAEQSFESRISNFESSARRIQKPSVVEIQKSIIDKFIQQQPKITPGKAAEYTNTQNLGKDSLEEDMTFVTETMAKLYAAQGKIDKAKKVYRQLIALHPEKSIYFAAQLKNLNQNKKI